MDKSTTNVVANFNDIDHDGSKSCKVLVIIDRTNKHISIFGGKSSTNKSSEIVNEAAEATSIVDDKIAEIVADINKKVSALEGFNGHDIKTTIIGKLASEVFQSMVDSSTDEGSDEESSKGRDEDDDLYIAPEIIRQLKDDKSNLEYFHAEDKIKPLLMSASKYGHITGGYVRDVLAAKKPGPFNDVDLWFTNDEKFLGFYRDVGKDGVLVCNNDELTGYDLTLKVYRLGYYRDNNLVTMVDAAVSKDFHSSDFDIHKLAARMTDNGPEFVSLGPDTPEYSMATLFAAISERKAKVLPEFYTKWREGGTSVRRECHERIERLRSKGWDIDESEKDYKHVIYRTTTLIDDIRHVILDGKAIVERGNTDAKQLYELLIKQTENAYAFAPIMTDAMEMCGELDD